MPSNASTLPPSLNLKLIEYKDLNARQQENYNFAKVSAILVDYGFATLRLSDDWQGADFIASHVSGNQFLKVQLKSRLWVDTKYKGKEVWICFRDEGTWYLYHHDAFLRWALANTTVGTTKGWSHSDDFERVEGAYSWPGVTAKIAEWLARYALAGRSR